MEKIQCTQKNTKVGDKVKIYKNHVNFSWFCNWYLGLYAETGPSCMEYVEFLVTSTDEQYLYVENISGTKGGWGFEMFYKEEANEKTNQDKFEVLNWIYKGIPVQYKNPFANGQEWDRERCEWVYKKSIWADLDVSANFSFLESFEYRIKPVEELKPEKFHFLIFAKGKYVVTSKNMKMKPQ